MSPYNRVRLLQEDPGLGEGLTAEELQKARQYAVAEVVNIRRGVHDLSAIGSPDLLGLFVLDGLLIRSVAVGERRYGELLGPGSLVRPWDNFGQLASLPFEVGWRALSPLTLALLDRRLTMICARWPPLLHELVRRGVERSHTVALSAAIHNLQHVELRVLVLFWHLADRFGRVTAKGIIVPLKLSHSDLAELTGTARPSVSVNLAKLAGRGQLTRRSDRTWLLRPDPPDEVRDLRARAHRGQTIVDG